MNHKSRRGQLTRLLFKRVKASINSRRCSHRGKLRKEMHCERTLNNIYVKWHRLYQQQ